MGLRFQPSTSRSTTTRRVGHHGQRGAEGEDSLGVELPGRALIEVEVAQSGLQGESEDRLDGLVLQDVLGSVQVVDRRELSLGRERSSASYVWAGMPNLRRTPGKRVSARG